MRDPTSTELPRETRYHRIHKREIRNQTHAQTDYFTPRSYVYAEYMLNKGAARGLFMCVSTAHEERSIRIPMASIHVSTSFTKKLMRVYPLTPLAGAH